MVNLDLPQKPIHDNDRSDLLNAVFDEKNAFLWYILFNFKLL